MELTNKLKEYFSIILNIILIIIVIVGAIIGYKAYKNFISEIGNLTNSLSLKDRLLADLSIEHDGHIDTLNETINQLRKELEMAEGKTEIKVVYRDRANTVEITETLPPDCIDCFEQIDGLTYSFATTYFTLNDYIYLENDKLVSKGGKFKFTEDFNLLAEQIYLKKLDEYVNKVWRIHWFITADAGIKDDADNMFSNIGLGTGFQFASFKKYLGEPLGLFTYIALTPIMISEAHWGLGVDYMITRNLSLGLSYGRSWAYNHVLLNINFYLFD